MPARGNSPLRRITSFAVSLGGLCILACFLAFPNHAVAQSNAQTPLPSAPQPKTTPLSQTPAPCQQPTEATTPDTPGPTQTITPCPSTTPSAINWFARFLNGPQVKPLSPKEKAHLAARNLLDPFNALTILAQSAITIGFDSHTPYGPGMAGFARNVGVSYTQELTGEFFGTFLIPSLVHEDPHYHRMPKASIPRRIGHAIFQVVWTQGDNDRNMINWSNIAGGAVESEISNLYVPGISTNAPGTASRYAIGLATTPIDNFITEFLPDVARHIHIRVVLVQRIINQVAKTEGSTSP